MKVSELLETLAEIKEKDLPVKVIILYQNTFYEIVDIDYNSIQVELTVENQN